MIEDPAAASADESLAAAEHTTAGAAHTGLGLYLAGNLGLTLATGIQQVIFAWLIAEGLRETPQRLGAAQAALMLPGLALILVGGVAADRVDAKRLLPPLHLLGALPPLAIAQVHASGELSYAVMIAYALAMGAIGAFIGPARDALLSRVAGGAIQRAVTLLLTITYAGQLAGFFLVALEAVSPVAALRIQSGSLALAALAYAALRPPLEHTGAPSGRGGAREIADAMRETLASQRLRAALFVQLSIGVLLAGTWVVLLQLVVRDVYGGGLERTSLFLGTMMVGTLTGTLGVAVRGGVRRIGRALLAGLTLAAVGAIGVSFAPPLPLALAAIVLWGIGGGLAMVMVRTLSQESAPPAHRARVLSLFQLAIIGGAPLGAFAAGQVVATFGAAAGAAFPAIGLLTVVGVALATSDLALVQSHSQSGRSAGDVPPA